MTNVYLCHPRRSAIGRFGGALSSVRPDDLAAHIFKAVLEQAPELDPAAIEEVMMGCANQAGEDNRNVARMSALLAGLPTSVPGTTLNRLCGSGMDAVGTAFRAIRAGEMDLVLAGVWNPCHARLTLWARPTARFPANRPLKTPPLAGVS